MVDMCFDGFHKGNTRLMCTVVRARGLKLLHRPVYHRVCINRGYLIRSTAGCCLVIGYPFLKANTLIK